MTDRIKLIAADMDGTLLNDKKQLSKDMFRVVRELGSNGVHFVIASGRQCYNLALKFSEVAEELYYIGESGATIFHGTQNIAYTEIPVEKVKYILSELQHIPDIFIVLGGLESAYYTDDNPVMISHSKLYYERFEHVSNFEKCFDKDRICKIAVYSKDAERLVYPFVNALKSEFSVMLSDATLVDIMMPNVSKASALEVLRQKLGIMSNECMVFGDYLNDYEMICECPNSYAMANAHPKLKIVATHVTEYDNEHHGVIRTICQKFRLNEPQDSWLE